MWFTSKITAHRFNCVVSNSLLCHFFTFEFVFHDKFGFGLVPLLFHWSRNKQRPLVCFYRQQFDRTAGRLSCTFIVVRSIYQSTAYNIIHCTSNAQPLIRHTMISICWGWWSCFSQVVLLYNFISTWYLDPQSLSGGQQSTGLFHRRWIKCSIKQVFCCYWNLHVTNEHLAELKVQSVRFSEIWFCCEENGWMDGSAVSTDVLIHSKTACKGDWSHFILPLAQLHHSQV